MVCPLGRTRRWVTKESWEPSSLSNFTQGYSAHSAQASRPRRFAQQVRKEQDGCARLKPSPPQPGQREAPAVVNLGHSPQSIPQQPRVGYRFSTAFASFRYPYDKTQIRLYPFSVSLSLS